MKPTLGSMLYVCMAVSDPANSLTFSVYTFTVLDQPLGVPIEFADNLHMGIWDKSINLVWTDNYAPDMATYFMIVSRDDVIAGTAPRYILASLDVQYRVGSLGAWTAMDKGRMPAGQPLLDLSCGGWATANPDRRLQLNCGNANWTSRQFTAYYQDLEIPTGSITPLPGNGTNCTEYPSSCFVPPQGGLLTAMPTRMGLSSWVRGTGRGDTALGFVLPDMDTVTGLKRLAIGYQSIQRAASNCSSTCPTYYERYRGGVDPSMNVVAGDVGFDCRGTMWLSALVVNATDAYLAVAYKLRTDTIMRSLTRLGPVGNSFYRPWTALAISRTSLHVESDAVSVRGAWVAVGLGDFLTFYRVHVAAETTVTNYTATDSCGATTTCTQRISRGTLNGTCI